MFFKDFGEEIIVFISSRKNFSTESENRRVATWKFFFFIKLYKMLFYYALQECSVGPPAFPKITKLSHSWKEK